MKTNAEIIFETELEPHADALFRFAYHLCHSRSEADDLLQETYIKAWKAIDSFEQNSSAKAWLFCILKNMYINRYRQQKRIGKTVDFDDNLVAQKQNTGGDAGNSEKSERNSNFNELSDDLMDNPFGDEVTGALKKLTAPHRTILLLSLEDFKYKEIANILDIDIDTVRSRLFRARGEMRKYLTKYAAAQGIDNLRDD